MLLDALGFEPATVDILVARTGLPGSVSCLDAADSRARRPCGGSPGRPLWPNTLMMTTGSVLDILIYVFDRYMLDEQPEVPEREHLARDLERAGFAPANVERALDWLTDLAFGNERGAEAAAAQRGVRVFSDSELARLSTECRGLLLTLERARRADAAAARARDRAHAGARCRRTRHRAAQVGGAHGALEPAGPGAGGRAARRPGGRGAPQCAALSRSARRASVRSAARPRFFVFRHVRFS